MNLTTIFIVGIIAWAVVSITNRPRSNKKTANIESELKAEHEQMKQELAHMAERLAVLEKIVTDEKYQLNKEFDSLKD